MAIRNIVHAPNKVLSVSALEVKNPTSEEIKKLIADMKETLLSVSGFGLAAPQVGVSSRVIVINYRKNIFALINPVIEWKSNGTSFLEEGCLSLPELYVSVLRPKKVIVSAIDEGGNKIEIRAKDMLAKILQHEIDHTNGILISDYLNK